MKKSHRKDVVIARIIFAVLCIVVIAVIVGVVMLVRANRSELAPKPETQQQTQVSISDITEDDTTKLEETQTETTEELEMYYMWTTAGVNLRSEPNTECEVITVLESGTQVRMMGEEAGWVKVSYNGQEGYIKADYLSDQQ